MDIILLVFLIFLLFYIPIMLAKINNKLNYIQRDLSAFKQQKPEWFPEPPPMSHTVSHKKEKYPDPWQKTPEDSHNTDEPLQ